MSKQILRASPTPQLTGFLISTLVLLTPMVQTHPQATHPMPLTLSSSLILLLECPPASWNFIVKFFKKPFSTFWQLLEWQGWGRDKLHYWGPGNQCRNQWALRSPTLSEEWFGFISQPFWQEVDLRGLNWIYSPAHGAKRRRLYCASVCKLTQTVAFCSISAYACFVKLCGFFRHVNANAL